MDCTNCPYKKQGDAEPLITHPQGNLITIAIPMTSIMAAVTNGRESKTEWNFPIYNVRVALTRGKKQVKYTPRVSVNAVTFTDNGELPVGTYDIIITYTGTDAQPYTWRRDSLLRIIETMPSGGKYTNDEMDVIARYPIVNSKISAIDVTDNEVTINEGRGFTGDTTPNDSYADMSAEYGDSTINVGENEVTITI